MKRITATDRVMRIRRQGAGFAFESPALYLWDERLAEVMRDAREHVGERFPRGARPSARPRIQERPK